MNAPDSATLDHPTAEPAAAAECALSHQDELRDQGYTIMRSAIGRRQLDELRSAIDQRLSGTAIADHGDHLHETNLVAKESIFREVAQHPLVLATVEGLLGEDCILSSCNQGTRKPECSAQAMHRDMHIWGPSLPWMPIPIGIQVAWCVDDFTIQSGATMLVPGSHLRADARADEAPIAAVAPAGSMILFDARTYHAGGANRSDRFRRAVLCFYVRSWLKPQSDHKRSIDPALTADLSTTMARLLGFQRQSPVEREDGTSQILPAPGATGFYG
ncbi:MAG: phytanoyl-CoA dioxygenase family protein [Planctomycetes bacterium]|nr:phytanoyl-CoA dioxygenase family protein [Planctomycetota bacterium]